MCPTRWVMCWKYPRPAAGLSVVCRWVVRGARLLDPARIWFKLRAAAVEVRASSVWVFVLGQAVFAALLRVRSGAREALEPSASESGLVPRAGSLGSKWGPGPKRLGARSGLCGGPSEVGGAARSVAESVTGEDKLVVRVLLVPGGAFLQQHIPF